MGQLADDLRAAKALIDTPDKWSQGAFCRDASGRVMLSGSPGAMCICSVEAIMRVTANGRWSDTIAAVFRAPRRHRHLADWQDASERTHADVMAAFDRAIVAAEPAPCA